MAALFFFFALLQLNDPDPVLWCSLYLVPAALSLGKFQARFILALGVLYGALALWWWNYASSGPSCGEMFGHVDWPEFFSKETVREASGLGIAAAWLLTLASRLGPR
jgi:hypothetical protein